MRHFTAIITQAKTTAPFEAVTVELPLPVVSGRSLSEVQDNLLTAIQRHIDLACEADQAGGLPALDPGALVQRQEHLRRRPGLVVEIPEYLLTRN